MWQPSLDGRERSSRGGDFGGHVVKRRLRCVESSVRREHRADVAPLIEGHSVRDGNDVPAVE